MAKSPQRQISKLSFWREPDQSPLVTQSPTIQQQINYCTSRWRALQVNHHACKDNPDSASPSSGGIFFVARYLGGINIVNCRYRLRPCRDSSQRDI